MTYNPPLELYKKVGLLLNQPLSKETYKQQLIDIESLSFEIGYATANAYMALLEAREQVKLPKDKEYTELDRKVHMESQTALIERDWKFLEFLQTYVGRRLELIKLFS